MILTGCAASESTAGPTPTEAPTPSATPQQLATPTATANPTSTPTASPTEPPPDPTATPTSIPPTVSPTSTPSALAFYPTNQRPDGNRFVPGQGRLPDSSPIDIPLAGEPTWVVGAPAAGGNTVWTVTLADGRVQAFRVTPAGSVESVDLAPAQLPPGMPLLLVMAGQTPSLLMPAADDFSPLTHPVPLSPPNRLAYITAGGGLVIESEGGTTALDVTPLPDARILVDEQERLLLLTGPSTLYPHAVLADNLEATGITLIETRPIPRVVTTIPIPEPSVVEGIAPIWADLTGDGVREIIVTLSNADQGSQLVVFSEAGDQIAAGPAVGQVNRWRHQIAVAPFGLAGELELADVLTPHLGRITEFFQLDDNALEVVATVSGYTSHRLGSRNLDSAAAADFDGDGHVELLIPNPDFTEFGALGRTADGADVVWTMPVDSIIATNLATVTSEEGHISVGVGRVDWVLRVWP
ncbi:MAG: hypothetical protein KDI02_10085 [Anaerolineae bacterium]|nr:hypothetical protein [Anaerolineae bacterium]